MSVTLNIIADTTAELVQEFRTLNAMTTASIGEIEVGQLIAKLSLDDLVQAVRERLRDEGFKLEVIDQRDQNPPASPPETAPEAGPQPEPPPIEIPAPKTKRAKKANGAGVPAPIPAETTIAEPPIVGDEDPTSPKPSKKAPEPASDPEEDRQHVMDTLGGLATKSKLKSKVFDFAGRLAKQHGKTKLSELPADPFPVIRAAMEKEFADDLRAAP